MRYLLQRPLPDEILTSALVRTCVYFDIPIKGLLSALGLSSSSPSFFHMSNIAVYARVLRMDPVLLLHKSTLFPTIVAFQTWDRRTAFQEAATHGRHAQPVRLSALQSTTNFVPFRRFCSACVRADRALYGWSYWHVSHQLPGASLCVHHDIRLRQSTLTTSSGRNRWSYQLPQDADSSLSRIRATTFDRELNRLAIDTQEGGLASTLSPLPLRSYREQLVRAGLVSDNRAVNASAARKWIATHLKGAAGAGGLLQVDPSLSWVDLILRDRPGIPFPACKHLIIQAAISSTQRPDIPLLNHRSSGYRGKDVREIDVRKSQELDARIKERLAGGRRFTLKEELETLGVWNGYRHNRAKYPAITAVIVRHRAALLRLKNRRDRSPSARETAR